MKATVVALSLCPLTLLLFGCGGGGGGGGGDLPVPNVPSVIIAPGVSMPMLAAGTMTTSNAGCSVSGAVEQWLRLGGRHIDMSRVYNTLSDAGKGIKASGVLRKDLFLTTKIEGPIGFNKTVAQATLDLTTVGVDYFDLLLIHWPCPNMSDFPNKCGSKYHEQRLDTWRGLEYLKNTSKARAIGVSNFNDEQVQQLLSAGYLPAVNQVQWHLGYHNDTFLDEMGRHGVKVEAWAPLAGPTSHIFHVPGISLGDPRLKAVAERYNASTAQIALQWSVRKGVTPVTATCVKAHAIGDLTAFGFNLSSQDMTYLDALKENSSTLLLV